MRNAACGIMNGVLYFNPHSAIRIALASTVWRARGIVIGCALRWRDNLEERRR